MKLAIRMRRKRCNVSAVSEKLCVSTENSKVRGVRYCPQFQASTGGSWNVSPADLEGTAVTVVLLVPFCTSPLLVGFCFLKSSGRSRNGRRDLVCQHSLM